MLSILSTAYELDGQPAWYASYRMPHLVCRLSSLWTAQVPMSWPKRFLEWGAAFLLQVGRAAFPNGLDTTSQRSMHLGRRARLGGLYRVSKSGLRNQ